MFKQASHYLGFLKCLVRSRIKNRSVPLIVILCVTNKCNLKCWYCYGEHCKRLDWLDFTKKDLLGIITKLYNLGTKVLQFQGGEPLLRNDLEDIIKKAKSFNMIVDMVTNGTLISERRNVISLLDKICVSLDGPKKLNDKNRGEGNFNKVVEGINIANSLGLSVRISAVLTSDTSFNDIDWLLNFASRGNMLVNFSPSFDFVSQVTGSSFKPHDIADSYLKNLFNYIAMHKNTGSAVQFSALSYKIASQWPVSYSKRTIKSDDMLGTYTYPHCYHGKYIFFIDSDGSLYPCCNFWGKAEYNIMRDGLESSIQSLSKRGCQACYIPAYLDRNLFFKGNLNVWWNYFKQVIRGNI